MAGLSDVEPVVIEIIERSKNDDPLIVPNEVRLNGRPLLCSADHPVIVHEITTRADELVCVTLTLLVRRVFIGHESDLP